jgi:Cellulase M and related proteins
MKELIQKLISTASPSGYEGRVREVIKAEVKGYASSIEVDALGNLIVTKGKKSANGKRVMIAAHMDEIGLIATHIDKKGFVRFSNMGFVYARNCMAAHVTFLNGVRGVINGDALEEGNKAHTLDQLFIDVGATSPEDCPVHVGDVGVFERPLLDLGKRVVSKALDDRIGCALMIAALKQIDETPNELVFVFTTQEEVGTRGATSTAYRVDPDLGLAVDVTRTGDVPTGKMEVDLGKGPAIKVKDGGMIADPRVVRWMTNAAVKAGLPHQMEVLEGGTTDARAIQLARSGVPAGCLSIPTRYIHSPAEMVDMDDVENSLRLLVELLRNPIEIDE